MLELIRNIAKCQRGATAVEYGLIVSLIVIVMIAALGELAGSTSGMWGLISNRVTEVVARN